MSVVSPTLELACQRAMRPPPPASRARAIPAGIGAARTALAVVISWLAAGALVVGIAWLASTLGRSGRLPADTLPYALVWTGIATGALATSLGSLFARSRRQTHLLGAASALTLTMVAAVAAQL